MLTASSTPWLLAELLFCESCRVCLRADGSDGARRYTCMVCLLTLDAADVEALAWRHVERTDPSSNAVPASSRYARLRQVLVAVYTDPYARLRYVANLHRAHP